MDYERQTFEDRRDAGRSLAARLVAKGIERPVVLGLARGGVIVAREVAALLGAPLDVAVVRKIGAPGNPELGVGAVAPDGAITIDEDSVIRLGIGSEELSRISREAAGEVDRRLQLYRAGRAPSALAGRTVILVDDGLATGVTARAALRWLRTQNPSRTILAVPVASESAVRSLESEADELVCDIVSDSFISVGAWYREFEQTTDAEVIDALKDTANTEHMVHIIAGGVEIEGDLSINEVSHGVVIFAHGSGSSRFSPRSQFVARALEAKGIGTLIVDLHTEQEEELTRQTGTYRLDIDLLAERILAAARWLKGRPESAGLAIGLFGASTGAGAALVAAAGSAEISAVVSRGGRPDLAGDSLPYVMQPTLLIVGGKDTQVLALNETALRRLRSPEKRLEIVEGATHLFEEPGALNAVAELTVDWFDRWLPAAAVASV